VLGLRVCEQFEARAVRPACRDEAGAGLAEHELVDLAVLAAHLQQPSVIAHGDDPRALEGPAEVGDPGVCADAREWS